MSRPLSFSCARRRPAEARRSATLDTVAFGAHGIGLARSHTCGASDGPVVGQDELQRRNVTLIPRAPASMGAGSSTCSAAQALSNLTRVSAGGKLFSASLWR